MKGKQRCVACGSVVDVEHDSPLAPPVATHFYIAVRLTSEQLLDRAVVAAMREAAIASLDRRIERHMLNQDHY